MSTQRRHGPGWVAIGDAAGLVNPMNGEGIDYGLESGMLAARIIRGETPATIPFLEYAPTKLMVNLDVARKIGFTVPAAVITRADEVIGR